MENIHLSELAQKAKQGDMSAFEAIYTELSPEIYSITYEISRSREEARDLTHDCFVAAMENISTLKNPDRIKNWLIRIAVNKSHDYLKKKKPSVLTEEQSEIFDKLEEEDISLIPETALEKSEQIEEVNEILDSLSEEKRLCLLLRYRYDLSYAEIAQELGITESAVKSRISRAKDDIEKEAEKRRKKGLPLFSTAPFGLIILALKRTADISAASFAGSASQTAAFAGITAASQAGSAAAAGAAAGAGASTAGSAATATTGIGAKVAAMSVAQKVVAGVAAASIVTGSAVGTTVAVKNKAQSETTTAYVEEYTTAPDYGFENETVFIPANAETESLTSALQTTSANKTVSVSQTKTSEKSTVSNKATTRSTTKANTTTQKQTTTTTKAATTKKETTTQESTTAKPTTTKAVTTAKATTTTTTKATTTAATTESASPATVTVTIWGESSSTIKTLRFEAGEEITAAEIENRLSDEYGIEAIADDINITAEAGCSYTATAYE